MYNNTKSQIKYGSSISEPFITYKGVKQGDALSPSLFNIYVNDVSTMFQNICEPVKLGKRYINHLLYADDMIILLTSLSGLQNCLSNLYTYCKR